MATLTSGSVRFDNVSDEELSKLYGFISAHEGKVALDTTRMTTTGSLPGHHGNVVLTWTTSENYSPANEAILLMLGVNPKA